MGLPKEKIDLLRKFVGYYCEECKKHEQICGVLQPHKIHPKAGYILRNIKLVCDSCHKIYTSADSKASGTSTQR